MRDIRALMVMILTTLVVWVILGQIKITREYYCPMTQDDEIIGCYRDYSIDGNCVYIKSGDKKGSIICGRGVLVEIQY